MTTGRIPFGPSLESGTSPGPYGGGRNFQEGLKSQTGVSRNLRVPVSTPAEEERVILSGNLKKFYWRSER